MTLTELCGFDKVARPWRRTSDLAMRSRQDSFSDGRHTNNLQIRNPWRTIAKRLRQGRRKIFSGINELIALKFVLFIVELAVSAISCQQILMRSPLDDLATFQHQ